MTDTRTLESRLARLESELEASRERFHSVVQHNVDGLLILDQEGTICFANAAAERILCRPADELQGEMLGLPILAGETVEVDLVGPDGQLTTAEMRIGNTTWDGAPAFLISLRDTTERKQAEAKIRFQAQLLDSVVQSIVATDPEGQITYWGRGAEMLYGWRAEEAIGKNVLDVTPTLQTREQAAEIMESLRQGQSWSGQFLVRHRAGHTFPVIVTDSPIQDEQGNLSGIVGVSTDISELNALQQALTASNERLQNILSSISDAFFALDDAMTVTYWNAAAERVLGKSQAEVLGHHLFEEAFPEAQGSVFEQKYRWALEHRRSVAFEAYFGAAPYEDWYDVRVYPYQEGIAVYFQVVTERKQAQERIVRLNAILRAIRNVNQLIARSTDRRRLLPGVCQALVEAQGYRSAWIALFDRQGQVADFASAGADPAFERLVEHLDAGTLPRCVELALSGTEVAVLPTGEACGDCPVGTSETCRHKLCTRLAHRDRVYGVMTVSVPPDVEIDERDRRLFLEVTADVAFALHSLELEEQRAAAQSAQRQALEQARQREREMTALLEGAQAVLQYQDFEQAARTIFDICKAQLGATSGYVAMLSDDGQENEVLFLDAGGRPCTVDPALPMPIRGLRAKAYRSGHAVYENDFADSEWTALLPPGHARLDNVLFAPLILDGQPVGLIGLANKRGGFTPRDARLATALGQFASLSLLNSRTLASLREREAALQTALREKESMLAEIHHRVKNNLQVVSGLLDLQAQYIEDEQATEALQNCRHRVYAMSLVHEQLYHSSDLARIDMAPYVQAVVSDLLTVYRSQHTAVSVDVQIDHLYLDVQQAIPCGMLINELVSNALEHAFPRDRQQEGAIDVSLRAVDGDACVLQVADNGVGLPPDFRFPTEDSLGMFLIDTLVKQLKGAIVWRNHAGAACHIEFARALGESRIEG